MPALLYTQVSPTIPINVVGNSAINTSPQRLSGTVTCTTFGCYVATNILPPSFGSVVYIFSPEENCSFYLPPVNVSQTAVISPMNTFTLNSSPTFINSSSSHMLEIYTTITDNRLSYTATVVSTSLSMASFVSSAAPPLNNISQRHSQHTWVLLLLLVPFFLLSFSLLVCTTIAVKRSWRKNKWVHELLYMCIS